MANFGDLREILQQPATPEAWDLLADGLQHWYGTEPLQSAIEYCSSHVSHWPDDLATFAPKAWFKRPPELYAQSPITAFFAFCFGERSSYFIDEARATLAACKPLKPPKFVDLDALGELRWRSGEAFDEEHKKRLVKLLRENDTQLGNVKLERLRQLLNDEDSQRWSRTLKAQWVSDGEKSAHKWALFQLAYLGMESDISFTTSSLRSMVSSGQHVRASQYLAIKHSFESREGMASVADFALEAPIYYNARHDAVALLASSARSEKLTMRQFIARRTAHFEPLYSSLDSAHGEELGEALKEAMVRQIDVPAWRLKQGLFANEDHKDDLATVVFAVGKKCFRVTADGPVTRTGKAFELLDKQFVHVAHPAEMKAQELAKWSELLVDESHPPLFAQLTREVFTTDNPIIPSEGIDVRNMWFHGESNFTEGREEGNGYTSTLTYAPTQHDWYVSLDLNYFIRVGYGDPETSGDTPPQIIGMALHSKLDDRIGNDPVIYSEACLMVRDAITIAQQEES
jgi:hypothetical protein